MMNYDRTYIMFAFEWTKEYQAYEYAFNCRTGQIADDHGFLEGNEEDFRFVIAINSLTRLSELEWDGAGNDIFTPDLKAIGEVLATQAGFDKGMFSLRKPVDNGEAVFVYEYRGGFDPSTPNGPAEGWTETEYIGELNSLVIRNLVIARPTNVNKEED